MHVMDFFITFSVLYMWTLFGIHRVFVHLDPEAMRDLFRNR
jgi:hypothetical protein